MKLEFNLQGAQRKELVKAIEGILETKAVYLKTPTYGYDIGNYNIDKNGTLTGADDFTLVGNLMKLGFKPDNFEYETEEPSETTTEPHAWNDGRTVEDDEAEIMEIVEVINATKAYAAETEPAIETATDEPDRLTIEMPLDGFDPAKIEILGKMVEAKALLLMMALDADNLNIQLVDGKLKFPWFKGNLDGETVNAYATLISKLCETVKNKSRVTAKAQDVDSNPKFSFRVWLISLGMVGDSFKEARRILLAKLPGNSAWKAGSKPEQPATEGEIERVSAEAPADTPTETEVTKEVKSDYELMMEQLPEGTNIINQYNAAENGELRIITDEDGQKRYMVEREENGYPRLVHKP